ncbi:hypothetical protein AUI51_00635 [archaeon 13_1_40CM_2_52_4]|nr:MAG: hypothetical protein AUI51_00635 [archaeon 13_1_40CM_2_52_4]
MSKRDLISIQKQLVHYDDAREAVLSLSRTATRLAGSSILEIHRGDMESASSTLHKVEQTLSKIEILSNDFSEFKSSSGVVVAFQEYVEAMTLRSFAQSERIPTISELKTDNRSYGPEFASKRRSEKGGKASGSDGRHIRRSSDSRTHIDNSHFQGQDGR